MQLNFHINHMTLCGLPTQIHFHFAIYMSYLWEVHTGMFFKWTLHNPTCTCFDNQETKVTNNINKQIGLAEYWCWNDWKII